MNHSLIGADRGTYFKIVAVALIAGIVVIAVGFTAANRTNEATADINARGAVVKAGKPATFTSSDSPKVQ